jgi:hypothetical protein
MYRGFKMATNPYVLLFLSFIFWGLALSGKFSTRGADICIALAFIVGAAGIVQGPWHDWRFTLAGILGLGIVCLFVSAWIQPTAPALPTMGATQPVATGTDRLVARPSLVFVFGSPLGDNESASWIMMLRHYGPAPAHNCQIIFYDDDRKNIDHEWRVKHRDSSYPSPSVAGESQRHIQVQEAGPEGSIGSFVWNPLDPNSQHYTVSIDCRDGYFVEKWEVARVNGILRSAITIEHGARWVKKNPGKESVVFRYRDLEFVPTALATEMPKAQKGKVVHPGWKPSYRFAVPAAIIDPNGNVQVMSGVKLPDGSTLTDFGSWNILTKHFGDKPD